MTDHFSFFYAGRNQYAFTCWLVPGSTLAGLRGIDRQDFAGMCAAGLRDSYRFALIVGELTLRCADLWGEATAQLFRQFDTQVTTPSR